MSHSNLTVRLCRATLIAVATLAVSHSYADWNNNYSEGNTLVGNHFTNFGPGGTATEIDQSKYEKVNLGPFGTPLWAPKHSVVAHVEDASARRLAEQDAELRSRLLAVGGWGNP